jgi:hypothetical protein
VVADAPLSRYGEAELERGIQDLGWVARCAVGHQEVLEGVGGSRAVLPAKIFTLFKSDERALAHVARSSRKIARSLKRVAGCEEWGVRVALDGARAAALARASVHDGRVTTGAAFLLRKKQLRDAARQTARRARVAAGQLHRALAGAAVEARRRTSRPGEAASPGVLLEAAYLVSRRSSSPFRARARSLGRDLEKKGVRVSLTGPWPPYSFAEAGR